MKLSNLKKHVTSNTSLTAQEALDKLVSILDLAGEEAFQEKAQYSALKPHISGHVIMALKAELSLEGYAKQWDIAKPVIAMYNAERKYL